MQVYFHIHERYQITQVNSLTFEIKICKNYDISQANPSTYLILRKSAQLNFDLKFKF